MENKYLNFIKKFSNRNKKEDNVVKDNVVKDNVVKDNVEKNIVEKPISKPTSFYNYKPWNFVETDDFKLKDVEEKILVPTDIKSGDYVNVINFDDLSESQMKYLKSKNRFHVEDVILKNNEYFVEVGYNIPLKAIRFEIDKTKYDYKVLFLQFNLAIDTHGEPDPHNILRNSKTMTELFPKLINEKIPNTLVDFYSYSDIYRLNNTYHINNTDIKEYDFVFFGFATKHSNIPYYIQKYLKKNNIPFITYESYNLYDDKVYGMDIVNELGYDYLPTIQTIKLNNKIIDHVVNDFGFPVIVKITKLDQGKGVFKINSLDELKTFYKNHTTETTFIQKLIPNDGDTRIILIKNKVKLVVKRQTAEGSTEFRSNVALGGKAIPTTIPQNIIDMCEDISKHVECDIIGFDILKDMNTGKYYVMEINVSPHFSTFSVVTGVNIPGIITDYIVSQITGIESKPIEVVEETPVQNN